MKKIRKFLSTLIWKISGGRILTRTGRQIANQECIERAKRIRCMQDKLDSEHSRLRGWTSSSAYGVTQENPERDTALNQEISRTHKALGFKF